MNNKKEPSSATRGTKIQDPTDIKIDSKQHKSDEDMKMPASKVTSPTSPKREAEGPSDNKMGSKRYKSNQYKKMPTSKTCVRLVHKEIVPKATVKHEEGLQVFGYVPQREGDKKSDYIIAKIMQTRTKEGYFYPLQYQLQRNPVEVNELLHVVYIGNACVEGDSDQVLIADPTKTDFFPAHCIVIRMNEDETPESCMVHFAKRLNQFTIENTGEEYGQYKYPPKYYYQSESVEEKNLPWNYYLQNKSVCHFLRLYYPDQDDQELRKEDVMTDEAILIRFFGTVEVGRHVLERMTQSKWENLVQK